MARYIDADVLKREISGNWYTCEEIDETIDKQPTADVKPVVRGKWTDTTHGLMCSACETHQVYGSRFYNFCPICGAEMRGEK